MIQMRVQFEKVSLWIIPFSIARRPKWQIYALPAFIQKFGETCGKRTPVDRWPCNWQIALVGIFITEILQPWTLEFKTAWDEICNAVFTKKATRGCVTTRTGLVRKEFLQKNLFRDTSFGWTKLAEFRMKQNVLKKIETKRPDIIRHFSCLCWKKIA